MAEKDKNPEIRFKGFDDDWEERKIGDVLTEAKRTIVLEDNTTYRLVTVKRRNEGVVFRGLFKGKNILVKNYFEIKKGDYLISKRQVVHGANGIVPQSLDKAIVSNEYLVSVGNENITTEFWTVISKRPDMYKKFYVSSYGVDIEKLVFDVNDWKKRKIALPSLTEQKRITAFFKNLDQLITLHQHKYNKMVTLKKAMFEKMFPQNGVDVPEIRFKGFTEAWEQRKLSEITDYKNGKGHEDRQIASGKYELINLNSISIDGGLKLSGKFINETDSTLNINDLVMILSDVGHGDLLGRVALIPENNRFVLNQRVALLRPNQSINPIFLFYNINAHQNYFKSQGAGMSQLNISKSSVEDFTSLIPTLPEEQSQIGTFFKLLDTLITIQKYKLDKLRNIKKACLEKMFV